MSRPVLRPNVPESLRPLAGVFVAVALVLTMLGVVGPAQAARVAVPDPIAHYPLTKTTGINDVVGGKHGMLHYQDPNTITWDDGLTLASTSSAGPYASFPADLVSGNESVTISTWIKRDVPTGNYSAMFYGEAPNAQKRPVHYWLLNPSQPQGYFKSVFTNGTVTDQPWTTEVGPASSADSASTAHLRNSWAEYTTVITPTTIQGFLNGKPVGDPVEKTFAHTDFTNPQFLLGKSNYMDDRTYNGSFRDLRVYDRALSAEEIAWAHEDDLQTPPTPSDVVAQARGGQVHVTWKSGVTDEWAPQDQFDVSVHWEDTNGQDAGVQTYVHLPATATSHTFSGIQAGIFRVYVTPMRTLPDGANRPGPSASSEAITVDPGESLEKYDLEDIDLPAEAYGNLTLPEVGAETGGAITWASDSTVISAVDTGTEPNVVKKGAITRGATDQQVVLTATTPSGLTRQFPITVKAKVQQQDFGAYLFAYFNGEGGPEGESVRLAISDGADALTWNDLNGGDAVLRSEYGTMGLRDPFIMRSHEGDRFFMLATDLNTAEMDFGVGQANGSKYLEIWESTDLINWGEQRHVKVSTDFAGNTWAPEAFYDESIGAYVVYWASNLYDYANDVDPRPARAQVDSYNRMMYATTRDFVTFTDPVEWIDSERRENCYGMIDSSVIKDGETYYRFTKDEGTMTVLLEKSNVLRATVTHTGIGQPFTSTDDPDEWSLVTRDIGVGQSYVNPAGGISNFSQGEGPSIFPSLTNPDQWYLFIDQPSYHGGAGYAAMTSTDKGESWTVLDSSGLPNAPRHGTPMPITRAEYDRVTAEWNDDLAVASVAPLSLDVPVGANSALDLPETVDVTFTSGATRPVGVTWDPVDLSMVTEVGQSLVAGGRLDNGSAAPVTLELNAVAADTPPAAFGISAQKRAVKVGADTALSVVPTMGAAVPGAVTWSSSNTNAATVAADGTVTGVAVGEATITARAGDRSASVVIDVVDVDDDLVLWYDFDRLTAESTVVTDKSGNGRDGVVNGTGLGVAEGRSPEGDARYDGDTALSLPGGAKESSAAWIGLPTDLVDADQQDLTLSAWVNWDGSDNCTWFGAVGELRSRNDYLFGSPGCPGARSGVKQGRTEVIAQQSAKLDADQWHHVALVLEGGSSLSYFIDGVRVATQSTAFTAAQLDAVASPFGGALGKSFYRDDPYFGGQMDDVRIHSAALSADRIQGLMAYQPPNPVEPPIVEPPNPIVELSAEVTDARVFATRPFDPSVVVVTATLKDGTTRALTQPDDYTVDLSAIDKLGKKRGTITFSPDLDLTQVAEVPPSFEVDVAAELRPVAGQDRFETSRLVLSHLEDGLDVGADVFVVSGRDANAADALVAAPVAAVRGGGVVLTDNESMDQETLGLLVDKKPASVTVVGGTLAVSDAVVAQLEDALGVEVDRVSGQSRFETAAAVAGAFFGEEEVEDVLIASGESVIDALAGSVVAGQNGWPILYATADERVAPEATWQAIRDLAPERVLIAGGTQVVHTGVEGQLRTANISVERARGATRYDTAAKLAEKVVQPGLFPQTGVVIANGEAPADVLAFAHVAASRGWPVQLSQKTCLPKAPYDAITGVDHATIVSVGGANVLDPSLAGNPTRCP